MTVGELLDALSWYDRESDVVIDAGREYAISEIGLAEGSPDPDEKPQVVLTAVRS